MLSLGNVALLVGFVATALSYHHGEAVFPAIDAIARAAVNAKLDNIAAHRLAVAPVPQRQAGEPGQHLFLPDFVSQCSQPCIEIGCAEDLEYGWNVIYGLQSCKLYWFSKIKLPT